MSKPQRVVLSSIKPDIVETSAHIESPIVVAKPEELPLTSIENKLDKLEIIPAKRVKATFTFEAKPAISKAHTNNLNSKRGLENNSTLINQAIKKVKPNFMTNAVENSKISKINSKNEIKSLVVEDDDLMQKLKAHNKKFQKESTYVPQKFSSKDVKLV